MIKINLLVDEDYIEAFMMTLPQDKVIVIEENFEENRELLKNELLLCSKERENLLPYSESMQELDKWLQEKSE